MSGGRPTLYSPDLAAKILAEIASGKSLVKVCEAEDMPCRDTIYAWKSGDTPEAKAFSDKYARAVEDRAEVLAEEIITIADDDEGDYGFKEQETKDGKSAVPCILPDNIQRAKLRMEARKWTASRLFPRKYGDKVQNEVTGAEGGPIQYAVSVKFVEPVRGNSEP